MIVPFLLLPCTAYGGTFAQKQNGISNKQTNLLSAEWATFPDVFGCIVRGYIVATC
jgi:hypothetical protein